MRLAALALLVACTAYSPAAPPPAAPAPGPAAVATAPPPAAAGDPGRQNRRTANLRRLRGLSDEAADLPLQGLSEVDPRAGRVAFRTTCQVCHGLHARGDGPAAGALHPPPADLADPALAGLYTDALLYGTIRLGIPDTAMVGFGDQVDEPVLLAITAWVRTLPTGGI